jgi:hypothetical protein
VRATAEGRNERRAQSAGREGEMEYETKEAMRQICDTRGECREEADGRGSDQHVRGEQLGGSSGRVERRQQGRRSVVSSM